MRNPTTAAQVPTDVHARLTGRAARCRESLAGKPRGIVGRKENGDAGDVVRLPEATQRCSGRSRTKVAKAILISRLVLARTTRICSPKL